MAPTGETIVQASNGTTRSNYDATKQAAWTVVSGAGGGGGPSVQQIQDLLDSTLVAGANVTKAYDDAAGTITIAAEGGGGGGGGAVFPASTCVSSAFRGTRPPTGSRSLWCR